jgi:hypothetical protein
MTSLIHIDRFRFASDWTLGKILIDNQLDGYVVEDEIRKVKVKGETAIWEGTYPLGKRFSPKFSKSFYWNGQNLITENEFKQLPLASIKHYKPHELIWIQNVPGFEYILIHWGNTDDDSEGCLIVGSKIGIIKGQEGVTNSRIYYKKFYEKVFPKITESSTITIINK